MSQEMTRAESIEEQERARDSDKKPKSRRPANTAFRQQRLKAWQPILTPKSVLPLFFIVGVIFAPIGGVLLWASSLVQEISIDYSNCAEQAPIGEFASVPHYSATFKSSKSISAPSWSRSVNESDSDAITCTLFFEVPNELPAPVFMYYRLTNFYQNHRRYVQSLDLNQLKGDAVPYGKIQGGACDPLAANTTAHKVYYPCGLIANSFFNDTIGKPQIRDPNTSEKQFYEMTDKGIAWDSDKELIKQTKYNMGDVLPPPNWLWAKDKNGAYKEDPNLHENEAFMVWMRTAGLPSFSKLSRRNDTHGMPAAQYTIDIVDRFDVAKYDGTKSILISTRTVLGGKNPFMGIAYVVVGGICVVLGALFTVAHLVRPRKLGDHTYLTWDSNQPSTAIATGRDNAP
ncbi:LEM3/CDC50 family protein [Penicillium cf. griseofulvum]|nr:LEM3/CDC50 family protein [Penicillium cf. griseofulvum]